MHTEMQNSKQSTSQLKHVLGRASGFLLISLLISDTTVNAAAIVRDSSSPEADKSAPILLKPGDSLRIEKGFNLKLPTGVGGAKASDAVKTTTTGSHKIFNAGKIAVNAKSASGILALGVSDYITNIGTVEVGEKGFGAAAIALSSDDATIINDGILLVFADSASGINFQGTRVSIMNGGLLQTEGEEAHGIASIGGGLTDKASILNSGDLYTLGRGSYGIYSLGTGSVITNSGTLKTSGGEAHGIYLAGIGTEITNEKHGTITTQGQSSHGIFSRYATKKARISNFGAITTQGQSSHGIVSQGAKAIVTNQQGAVIQVQAGASGIVISGTSNSLINRGSISAALGATSYAILGTDGATGLTLEIEAGSRIIGKIDLGGSADGDTVRISDDGQRHLVIDNVEQVQFSDAIKSYAVYNTVGKTTTIRILDPATVEVSRGRALSALSGTLQRVSQQRLDHSRALGLTLSSARHFQARAPLAWGQVFGSSESVDAKGKALAYELSQQGFSLGYERDYQGRRLGLLGGVAITNSESDIESFEQKTTSTYFGAYAHFNLGDFNLATALIAGIDGHDNERLLIGSNLEGAKTETAKADFSGWFLSPSVSLSSVYDLNDQLELRPSLRLGYSLASQSKYTESGSEVNLTVKSRSLNALTAQLQVAAIYHLNSGMDLTAHLGFASSSRSEGKIETSLGTKSIPFAPLGESSESGLIAGLGLRTSLNERLNLAAGVESNADRLNYQLSLAYSF